MFYLCSWQASEKYCIRMPNTWNFSFDYFYASIIALGIYVPGMFSTFFPSLFFRSYLGIVAEADRALDLTFLFWLNESLLQAALTCTVICLGSGRGLSPNLRRHRPDQQGHVTYLLSDVKLLLLWNFQLAKLIICRSLGATERWGSNERMFYFFFVLYLVYLSSRFEYFGILLLPTIVSFGQFWMSWILLDIPCSTSGWIMFHPTSYSMLEMDTPRHPAPTCHLVLDITFQSSSLLGGQRSEAGRLEHNLSILVFFNDVWMHPFVRIFLI